MGRKAGVSADQTRKELITAAARVFAEKGYEGATIADIARQAGLSTGAIYAHFRSKAELLKHAIRAQSAREVARMWADCDPNDLNLLDAMVAGAAAFGRRHGGHGSLLIEAASAARRDPDLAEAMASEVGTAEERFVALLARGGAGFHASPEVIARFSLMLNLGLAGDRRARPTRRAPGRVAVVRRRPRPRVPAAGGARRAR